MADPKNSELPRANGKIAPAVWGGEEFVVLQGTKDGKMYVVGNVTMDNLPSEYKVIGTVNIGNLPEIQKVEVTNQKAVQDVSDSQVKVELEQIKQTQSQILERLDGQFDANLKEYSNDKPLPINNKGEYLLETLIDSQSIESGSDTGPVFLNPTNEMELYLFISIDVQPWELRWRNQFGSLSD